ncbi:MAG: hypothetical protein HY821_13065 [Acidobacteria bacterium]|nr:hypothetical protein [Acidobacteriota bacterium]
MSAPLPPERVRELLGGHAAGNLTAEEREALMSAALEDQALFDELMREEPLREALADPRTRAELLDALPAALPRVPWWKMSWPYAALASAAAAIAIFVVFRPQPQAELTAELRQQPAAEVTSAAPKPEPVPSEIAVPRRLELSPEVKQKSSELVMAKPEQKLNDSAALAASSSAAKKEAAQELQAAGGGQAVGGVQARSAASPELQANAVSNLAEKGQSPAAPPVPAEAPAPVRVDAGPRSVDADARMAAAPPAARMEPTALKEDVRLAKTAAGMRRALEVEVAFMQPDGRWKPAQAGATLPAGRALRLTVTSPVDGTLEMEPQVAAALAVRGGVPAEWIVPAQPAGSLRLKLSVRAAASGGAFRLQAGDSAARAAAPATQPGNAPGRGSPLVRELFLKFE